MNDELESRIQKLMYANKDLKAAMRGYQDTHKLRYGEFGVMASILDAAKSMGKPAVNTGIPMKMLSDERNCTPAMITKLITGLEEQGYVRRELSTDDRRGVKVCVTKKGYDVWESDHLQYHQTLEEIGSKMGMDRLMLLLELAEEFWKYNREVILQREKDSKESINGKADKESGKI